MKKTRVKKSRDTVPLHICKPLFFCFWQSTEIKLHSFAWLAVAVQVIAPRFVILSDKIDVIDTSQFLGLGGSFLLFHNRGRATSSLFLFR
jgi:hypothetical protein